MPDVTSCEYMYRNPRQIEAAHQCSHTAGTAYFKGTTLGWSTADAAQPPGRPPRSRRRGARCLARPPPAPRPPPPPPSAHLPAAAAACPFAPPAMVSGFQGFREEVLRSGHRLTAGRGRQTETLCSQRDCEKMESKGHLKTTKNKTRTIKTNVNVNVKRKQKTETVKPVNNVNKKP